VKAHPGATAIPHPGHLHAHRPNPGLHLTLWKVTIPDYRLAALSIVTVGILGYKHCNFGLNRLGQKALSALA
jgi:hypothetical protein